MTSGYTSILQFLRKNHKNFFGSTLEPKEKRDVLGFLILSFICEKIEEKVEKVKFSTFVHEATSIYTSIFQKLIKIFKNSDEGTSAYILRRDVSRFRFFGVLNERFEFKV